MGPSGKTDHVAEMRSVHFDVCEDGVLTYLDRTIGRYENTTYDLAIRLSVSGRWLELQARGRIAARFDLDRGVEQACMDASSAYFCTLADFCEQARRPILRLVS